MTINLILAVLCSLTVVYDYYKDRVGVITYLNMGASLINIVAWLV